MKTKGVIFFSIGAGLLITALILVLSFTGRPSVNQVSAKQAPEYESGNAVLSDGEVYGN